MVCCILSCSKDVVTKIYWLLLERGRGKLNPGCRLLLFHRMKKGQLIQAKLQKNGLDYCLFVKLIPKKMHQQVWSGNSLKLETLSIFWGYFVHVWTCVCLQVLISMFTSPNLLTLFSGRFCNILLHLIVLPLKRLLCVLKGLCMHAQLKLFRNSGILVFSIC